MNGKNPPLCGHVWPGVNHQHVCGELAEDHTLGRHYCKYCPANTPK